MSPTIIDRLCKAAALLLFGAVLLRTAWLAEDAFITFRTVDNFVHGYGLTWNVAERVQAYSNPLWLLLLIPFYWLSGEIFYTAIALSLAVSAAAVWALCTRAPGPSALLAVWVLVCSKAFTDYSTSGLENPLTHLLLALFAGVFYRRERGSVFWLSLLAALGAVNRLDAMVLFAPPLAYALWRRRDAAALRAFCCGMAPLALWECFSLFYYGFPFPNTAYAKLATGVPLADRLAHGVSYLYNSLSVDPITLTVVAAALALAAASRDRAAQALAAGCGCYVLYVIWIGGDFMSGRFFAAPFWVGVLLLVRLVDLRRPRRWAAVFAAAAALGLAAPNTPFLSGGDYAPARAKAERDERGKFYRNTGLLPGLRQAPGALFPDHWWAVRARAVRGGDLQPQIEPGLVEGMLVAPARRDSLVVAAWMNIGLSGFYAGPKVYIVDAIGLSDPLLARLPARRDSTTGPGHFGRLMPEGYLQTLISGEDRFADRGLAAYYGAVTTVVRGELLSRRRLAAIWGLNTGAYDDLVDRSFYRDPPPLAVALSDARMEPRNPSHHLRVAGEYFALGDDRRGLAALDEAANANPGSFFNFVVVGKMLAARGHAGLALRAYGQALRNGEAHLRRLAAAGDSAGLAQTRHILAELRAELEPGAGP